MKRILICTVIAFAAATLAGCGERPQELAAQKSGKYQGKPDTDPWKGEQWKGDKAQWENSLKARNQNQNEYTRTE
jgi:hypothetical protein